MLTGKQKRVLRTEANQMKPIFQVGKTGVNENMIKQMDEAIDKRELIKLSVLQNCPLSKEEVAEQLSNQTASEIVQIIGNNIVLYRKSKDNKLLEDQ